MIQRLRCKPKQNFGFQVFRSRRKEEERFEGVRYPGELPPEVVPGKIPGKHTKEASPGDTPEGIPAERWIVRQQRMHFFIDLASLSF
jgi:hypothetical protein